RVGLLARRMPKTFVAFFSGFVGISGMPPFGIFIGELLIVIAAFRAGLYYYAIVFILGLCAIFAGFAQHALRISFGESDSDAPIPEKAALVWPQYVLLLTSLTLCFWMPDTLNQTIGRAVAFIGGGFP
ncbi:MAG: hydrogenase, partial [Desulfatitalea sp.]|nr:hydrogenase [Desulfatitalea sp.]